MGAALPKVELLLLLLAPGPFVPVGVTPPPPVVGDPNPPLFNPKPLPEDPNPLPDPLLGPFEDPKLELPPEAGADPLDSPV